jgi:hypothetical protein
MNFLKTSFVNIHVDQLYVDLFKSGSTSSDVGSIRFYNNIK